VAADTRFVPDLEAWDAWNPSDVAAALDSVQVPWAIAGGWALDLHLGEVTRPHEDVEIVIARGDTHVLRECLPDLEWFAVGDGYAWPLADAPPEVHQTWGCDRAGRWRLDAFREPWDGETWVFRRDPRIRRPLSEAIEVNPDGIPYLAPEIVLLFKSKRRRDKDEADFTQTLPSLSRDRLEWLRQALRVVDPENGWTQRLTTPIA
jgi:hypothetical protein